MTQKNAVSHLQNRCAAGSLSPHFQNQYITIFRGYLASYALFCTAVFAWVQGQYQLMVTMLSMAYLQVANNVLNMQTF